MVSRNILQLVNLLLWQYIRLFPVKFMLGGGSMPDVALCNLSCVLFLH